MRSTGTPSPPPPPRSAVVVGAGIAGLLAARVLADHFDRVLIVERGEEPRGAEAREGGTPADPSPVAIGAGLESLEAMFPGLLEELTAAGAGEAFDLARDVAWWSRGAWKSRFESGLGAFATSRADLEERLRRRLLEIPDVRMLWGRSITGLDLDADGSRVVGVTLADEAGALEHVSAELVVDASGATPALPGLLVDRGLEPAPEEHVSIGLTMSMGVFELPVTPARDWRALAVQPANRRVPRGGVVLALGGRRYGVSLYGYQDDRPASREPGFRNFALTLAHPMLAQALEGARRKGEIVRFSVPAQVRRRYDRADLPEGVLAIGDALCRLDPVVEPGIGLIVSAAAHLGRELSRRRRRRDPLRGLGLAFHRAAIADSEPVWRRGGCFVRGAAGGRSLLGRLLEAYRREVERAGALDSRLHAAFLRVLRLERTPRSLFAPSLLARLLARRLLPGRRTPSRPPAPPGIAGSSSLTTLPMSGGESSQPLGLDLTCGVEAR